MLIGDDFNASRRPQDSTSSAISQESLKTSYFFEGINLVNVTTVRVVVCFGSSVRTITWLKMWRD